MNSEVHSLFLERISVGSMAKLQSEGQMLTPLAEPTVWLLWRYDLKVFRFLGGCYNY